MAKKATKNLHDGHRGRLRDAADKDPELESFSDYQSLEFLLSFLIPRKDTNEMAHLLIDEFGSFFAVLNASPAELFKCKNMTATAAHFLPNMIPLVRRAEVSRVRRHSTVRTISDAVKILRPHFFGRNYEAFYLVMLDINDEVISIDCLSRGNACATHVDMAALAAKVGRNKSVKVMMAHNHPGGNLFPSQDDIGLTQMVAHLMNTMGQELVDHIIFANDKYYSFYQNGDMDMLIGRTDNYFGVDRTSEVVRRRRDFQAELASNQETLKKVKADSTQLFSTTVPSNAGGSCSNTMIESGEDNNIPTDTLTKTPLRGVNWTEDEVLCQMPYLTSAKQLQMGAARAKAKSAARQGSTSKDSQ